MCKDKSKDDEFFYCNVQKIEPNFFIKLLYYLERKSERILTPVTT